MDSSYIDLKKAVEREDFETANYIIRSCRLDFRYAPEHLLFHAIGQTDLNVITFLLKSTRIDTKVENSAGHRLVHLAAEVGDKRILKEILGAGSSVNVVDSNGRSPLHLTLIHGFEEAAIYLISEGATINRPRCYTLNEAPIHTAARLNLNKALELMILRGGDLKLALTDGSTPLHIGVKNRHIGVVELLCRHGASTELYDKQGKSPINLALTQLSLPIIEVLLPFISDLNNVDRAGSTPLHYLAASQIPIDQHLDLYERLFERGVDIDKKDREGRTALHEAATSGNVSVCQILLDHGANVHCTETRMGETPLCTANAYNKTAIVKCLLANGSSPNHTDLQGKTPLHKLIMSRVGGCKLDSLSLLLEHGAKVNVLDGEGLSVLYQCCFHIVTSDQACHYLKDVLMRLISAGVALRYQNLSLNPRHHSPLCLLVWQGHLEAATILIEAGWDLIPEDWVTLPGNTAPVGSFLLRLHTVRSNPVSLQGKCREVIRACLSDCNGGTDISRGVNLLPLPSCLKEFVLGLARNRDSYI